MKSQAKEIEYAKTMEAIEHDACWKEAYLFFVYRPVITAIIWIFVSSKYLYINN